uniref:Uncharacterized protein n=1 Tax=Globisporangium ultimum (strain ATCC 200006 / CBS 805.95 / DAOM BR144) TaxID=431595 RepID=K3WQA4_GLOUD
MAAMLLPRSKAKDEKAAKSATAAATICDLCDVYTQNGLEGKWSELLKVYDQRRNDDNLREILALSAPTKRVNDLNGWHLERMAVGEYEDVRSGSSNDVAHIRRDVRHMKQQVNKIIANGRSFQARRDALMNAMEKQRHALTAELDAAKEFLGQIHLSSAAAPEAIGLSAPAPVEQRLLATVKASEVSANVDLSAAPSI